MLSLTKHDKLSANGKYKQTFVDVLIDDLRGYRLFIHISAALGGFMFTKRANRGSMRTSCNHVDCPLTEVLLILVGLSVPSQIVHE